MRVFLDECVDWRLARDLAAYDVKTARQMGWTAIKNGELLALVAIEFDTFVTVDGNIAFQQDLSSHQLAAVVLRAKSSRLSDLKPLVPKLLAAIEVGQPGVAQFVEAG